MKSIIKRVSIFFVFLLLNLATSACLFASDVEMADALRSNGKIYVVITVLSIVFTGIIIFLFLIERRLKKLEKGDH